MSLSIPPSIGDVTPQWLTGALHAGGALTSGSVTELSTEQIGVGVGIMGELFRASVRYDKPDAGPRSLVVKLPSPYEANRAQGVGLGMYEAEVRFYAELAALTAARSPRCYFATITPGTADFVILLEDLSGLTMADQVHGMSVDQVRAAARTLAAVAGSWWGRVDTPALDWIPTVVHPRIEALAGFWPALWPAFVANFGHRLPPGGLEVGEKVRDNYWAIMQALNRLPWTLIHEDYRCDNLFFDPGRDAGEDVVVIDWQGLARGPIVYDLAYLLGGSVTVADRRANEREIVAEFHRELVSRGVTGYSSEQLWHDYRLAHLVGGTATAVLTGATFDLANERGGELIGAFTERHFTAILDLGSVELIPHAGS